MECKRDGFEGEIIPCRIPLLETRRRRRARRRHRFYPFSLRSVSLVIWYRGFERIAGMLFWGAIPWWGVCLGGFASW